MRMRTGIILRMSWAEHAREVLRQAGVKPGAARAAVIDVVVHQLDFHSGGAQYEPAQPSGDHHHHLICGDCGKVEAFSDDWLERAIHTVSEASAFRIDEHDVVLRGRCEACA